MNPAKDFDVVVVGAGLSGLCAAVTVAEEGMSVAVLERFDEGGGSSKVSAGSFAFAGTQLQVEHGIADSPALLQRDLLAAAEGTGDAGLVGTYVLHQNVTYEWLCALGVHFTHVQSSPYQSVPRSHVAQMSEVLRVMRTALTARRGCWRSHTRFTGADIDTVSGRVMVRTAMESEEAHPIICDRLILCTGGFSRSRALLNRFAPHLADHAGGAAGCEGDGLIAGMALGAETADMEHLSATFGVAAARPEGVVWVMHPIYEGAIAVNQMGMRFTNESVSYKGLAALCMQQPNGMAWQVFDRAIMGRSNSDSPVRDFAGAMARGLLLHASSVEELEATADFPPGALTVTLNRYNQGIKQGDDEFSRHTLAGTIGTPHRIESPPFYAYPCTARVISTYAGLRTDSDMRVVKSGVGVLDAIYAAGEVTGGFHGSRYVSGTGLGKAAVFGRLAARRACESIRRD